MNTKHATSRPWMSLFAGFGLVCAFAVAPTSADAAENPIAKPRVELSKTIPIAQPGTQNYVLKIGDTIKQVKGKTIKVNRAGDGTIKGVWVDSIKIAVPANAIVSVAVATGSGNSNNNNTYASTTTTTTQLPGGGSRTDTTNGDGSTTTTIHDPAGGKNGGSRTTTSTTDTEGNTTTTTTTTDGGDGSTTTTTTTSP
jgi:hypothetical protein